MFIRQKIMVLDPSPIFRRTLKSVIEATETYVEVMEAEDVDDARRILTDKSPEVVFLDIALPRDNGIQFIAAIKEMAPDTRVVVLTSHDSEEHEAASIAEGADFFLSKERCGRLRLVDVIHTAIRRQRTN